MNWTTKEISKQPHVRKAGEEIILEHKWGTPRFNIITQDWVCDLDRGGTLEKDTLVVYTELSGPGALVGGYENLGQSDGADFIPSLFGGDVAIAEVTVDGDEEDEDDDLINSQRCISRALYSSEDPGEVDVEAVLCPGDCDAGGMTQIDPPMLQLMVESAVNGDGGSELLDKHPFLVFYVKIYSVEVSLVPGDLVFSSTNKANTVNDGFQVDPNEAKWSPTPDVYEPGTEGDLPSTDVRDETRIVSDYSLVRVNIKDWVRTANSSGRPDICLDMDGDGGGDQDAGIPYTRTADGTAVTTHAGCPDADDELLAGGYWLLPDDWQRMAGQQPELIRAEWDVLCGPGDTSCGGAGLIGPKRMVDTHDSKVRSWVHYTTVVATYKVINGGIDINGDGVVDGADDGVVCGFRVIDGSVDISGGGGVTSSDDGTLTDSTTQVYKSILSNGKINIWDAPMPLEKVSIWIDGSGKLLAVDKDAIYPAGNNPFYQVFIPGNDLIPAQPGGSPGYDWDSTIQGPYEFWHALQWLTLGEHVQVYSDNRGQAMALIYGDDNLSFTDCAIDSITGTPVCEPGDVVGDTTVSAIVDYPYFRKHRDVEGNTATITWEWAGYKRVTVEPVAGDPNHTYVVAHLLDRDGECIGENPTTAPKKWGAGVSDVRLEPVHFEVSGDGVIIGAALDGGILPTLKLAVALAGAAEDFGGTLPRAHAGSADECQAYILVEHGRDATVQVSIGFNEPEGLIRMSIEFPQQEVIWGDIDNDGDVDAVDALKIMQWIVGLPVATDPAIGEEVTLVNGAVETPVIWGDVDRDGDIDSVDALEILQFIVDGTSDTDPAIGDTVTII